MGPLGISHAAKWADGWMPVDIGLPEPKEQITAFRAMVVEQGRDPDAVPVTLQTMVTPDIDTIRQYEDVGVSRVIVGVAIDMWDKPDQVMPMIDRFGDIIARY
jgi:hypothetical protein